LLEPAGDGVVVLLPFAALGAPGVSSNNRAIKKNARWMKDLPRAGGPQQVLL